MYNLRDHIVEELVSHDLSVFTESMTDDDCVLLITRNAMVKTVATMERHRHRPMEIELTVDHAEVKNTKDVLRTTKPVTKQLDKVSFRWLWILPIFGGLIVLLISMFESFFASLYGSSSLSSVQLIITVTVLSTILAISWIYGLPRIFNQLSKRRKQLDTEVLELMRQKIIALDEALITTDVIRCWSCFTELEPTTVICTSCGETQK